MRLLSLPLVLSIALVSGVASAYEPSPCQYSEDHRLIALKSIGQAVEAYLAANPETDDVMIEWLIPEYLSALPLELRSNDVFVWKNGIFPDSAGVPLISNSCISSGDESGLAIESVCEVALDGSKALCRKARGLVLTEAGE
jgi:hypothetical protein